MARNPYRDDMLMDNGKHASTVPIRALADAARRAIRAGADPELALSYVIWPDDSALSAAAGTSA